MNVIVLNGDQLTKRFCRLNCGRFMFGTVVMDRTCTRQEFFVVAVRFDKQASCSYGDGGVCCFVCNKIDEIHNEHHADCDGEHC